MMASAHKGNSHSAVTTLPSPFKSLIVCGAPKLKPATIKPVHPDTTAYRGCCRFPHEFSGFYLSPRDEGGGEWAPHSLCDRITSVGDAQGKS